MDFEVTPLVGVGKIRFGMTQNEVRVAMGAPHEVFFKSTTSAIPTDAFLRHAVHVFYKPPGICVAVEFYVPSQVVISSKNLLGVSYAEVRQLLINLDPDSSEDDAGLTCLSLGVGVYAPSHLEFPDDATESVIVFKAGYYDTSA